MKSIPLVHFSFATLLQFISLFLFIYNPSLRFASARIKRWVPNTNYDNPKNWNTGQLPCDGANLTFPASSPPVYIQNDVSIISMELPLNGELILGEGVVISSMASATTNKKRSDASEGTCKAGQKVEFTRTYPLNWLDPNNWCEASKDTTDCSERQPNLLDTERVPCFHDDTVFPMNRTFLVSLNDTSDIQIKSIKISGSSYSTNSLKNYLQSEEGKKQFSLQAEIKVQNENCEDVTGCACGNDKGMIMHNICELQSSKCPEAYCDGALIPKGHCCPICGMTLIMNYGYGFKINTLKERINHNFIEGKKISAYVIVSKMSNEMIQVVVLDREQDGAQAKHTGDKIKQYIEKDIRGPKKLGLTDINVQTSGRSSKTAAVKGGSFSHSPGSIAGVVLTVLIVLLIIGIVMFCFVDRSQCQKHLKSPLKLGNPFRRFSSDNSKGDLEMDDSISYVDIMRSTGEAENNTFDNPMYNIPVTSAPNIQDVAKQKESEALNNNDGPAVLDPSSVTFMKTSKGMEGNTSFANPLFGANRGNPTIIDPSIRLNPIYSDEGIEEDSKI